MPDQMPPIPGKTPAAPAAPAAPQQSDKTPLTKIVEIAAAAAETAEPGSATRALAHVVRLLATRTLDTVKTTAAKLMAHDAQLKKLRSEVDEMAQLLVVLHEQMQKSEGAPEAVGEEAPAEDGAAPEGGEVQDGGAPPSAQQAAPAAQA